MNSLDIPDKFAQYADAMKATMKKFISIRLKPEPKLNKWQSKVGGEPYLLLDEQYPTNSKGEPLMFLAQVNFGELPHIEDLPMGGIVQFYIDGNDDLMGYNNHVDGYKVLYFSDVETDESKLCDAPKELNFPYRPFENNTSYSMEFTLQSQYMSVNDYRFENIAGDNYDDIYDEYNDLYHPNGHKIGGYPFFTQYDPRESNDLKDYELLFQLDSDTYITWGDMGVGAFFIKPDDLKKLDFSKVLFNWDCY